MLSAMTSLKEPTELLKVDTMGRVQTRRERREAILAEFDRSAMSAAAFAREYGINYQTFWSWVRKREKKGTPPKPTAWPMAEVILEGALPSSKGQPVEGLRVKLPGGAEMEIDGQGNSLALAAELLKALAKSC